MWQKFKNRKPMGWKNRREGRLHSSGKGIWEIRCTYREGWNIKTKFLWLNYNKQQKKEREWKPGWRVGLETKKDLVRSDGGRIAWWRSFIFPVIYTDIEPGLDTCPLSAWAVSTSLTASCAYQGPCCLHLVWSLWFLYLPVTPDCTPIEWLV